MNEYRMQHTQADIRADVQHTCDVMMDAAFRWIERDKNGDTRADTFTWILR